jgi:hypothetical protein
MKKLRLWFKKEFGVLTMDECIKLGLEFCHNIYGDEINHINCRSIWRDKKGKSYRCESLVNDLPFKI